MTDDLTTPIPPDAPRRRGCGERFTAGDLVAGRYRVVRRLGAGGMGEVYEVEDLGLHETVALKTIRPELLGDEDVVRRFRREIQLARKVTHGNVCRIHDLVEVPGPNGTTEVFLTMELLTGEPLDVLLRRRVRLAVGECAGLLKQVASGLAAAHQAGIVHRDFKPANVLVVPAEQGTSRAVITDFGLARAAGELQGASGSLTGSGQLLGSPAYMAPEQVTGRPITPATDVYAFGVAAYELLTGQRPFRGENALAVAMMRVREDPASPRSVEPSIPDAWERLILRCLRRDPSERYRDGEALLYALREPTADDEPTFPGGAVIRVAEPGPASKRRWRAGGLLGLLLLVLLWFGWRAWTARQRAAESADTVALVVAPFNPVNRAAVEEAATTTTILVQELRRRLERFPAVRVSVGASEEPPSTEGAAQRLGDRLRADVLIWGDVFSEGQRVVLRPKALRMARRFGSTNSVSHPPNVMSFANEADPLAAREARARSTAALALSLVADELASVLGDQVVLGLLTELDPGQGAVFEARLLIRADREGGTPRHEDWKRSVDLLESAGTKFPTAAVDAHRTLAGLFDDGCRLDLPATFCDRRRAARELERALELEPDDVRSLRLAARFAAASADTGLAIRHLGRLHEIDPTSPATIADLVSAHEWAGRDADAERLLAEIEGSAEADPWAAFMLFRHGRYEQVASGAPSAVNSEVVRRILALGARGDFSGSRREYEGYMRSLGPPGFWARLVASVRFATVAGDKSDIDVLARRPAGESNPGMYADVVRAAYADVLLWDGRVDEARAILAAREGPESVEVRFWTGWMAGDFAAGWKDLESRRMEREGDRSLEADVLASFLARRAGQAADGGGLLERAKRRRVSAIAERGNGRRLAETYDAASLLNDPAAPRMPVEAYLDVVRGAVDTSRAFDVLAGRPLRTCRREWTCWLAWYLGTDRLLEGDAVGAR
ncbi:MAG: serine/threonine protein kinase, partial [Thermoanaerobaculia bacterium]|nr:serine/threonine protein kinase [Thermoanaerobaculia bacterium]